MKNTRQQTYRELFVKHMTAVRKEFGFGQHSYTEGVNRTAARNIARNRARTEMRKLRTATHA